MSKNRPKKANTSADLHPTKSAIASSSSKPSTDDGLLYHKGNYMIILAGLGLIFLGYVLMSGGGQTDPNVFDEDVIYSTRRTLLAPMLILAGLGLEVWAVFKR